jgi:hypothetical protein
LVALERDEPASRAIGPAAMIVLGDLAQQLAVPEAEAEREESPGPSDLAAKHHPFPFLDLAASARRWARLPSGRTG